MTACTRAALRTGRAVPGVRRGREAFEVLIANRKNRKGPLLLLLWFSDSRLPTHLPTMYASPAAYLRSPVEIGALPIMRSCSPGNPDIRLGQATACLPRLRPCPQRSRRDSASGSSRRRKQLSTGKTQPDAKLGERESRKRNRNRQRKILMLIFSSTERPSQGLGGQLGDPGARAIQVV